MCSFHHSGCSIRVPKREAGASTSASSSLMGRNAHGWASMVTDVLGTAATKRSSASSVSAADSSVSPGWLNSKRARVTTPLALRYSSSSSACADRLRG